MITARLRSSSPAPELLIECHRRLREEARLEKASLLTRARKRARSYARHARLVGHKAGFAKGERESRERFEQILAGIERTYREALALARQDALMQAYQLAERLVADCILLNPAIMARWLDSALKQFPTSASLSLDYHPQYDELIGRLRDAVPCDIKMRMDASLSTTDFRIRSEVGSIDCSWRELLRSHITASLPK